MGLVLPSHDAGAHTLSLRSPSKALPASLPTGDITAALAVLALVPSPLQPEPSHCEGIFLQCSSLPCHTLLSMVTVSCIIKLFVVLFNKALIISKTDESLNKVLQIILKISISRASRKCVEHLLFFLPFSFLSSFSGHIYPFHAEIVLHPLSEMKLQIHHLSTLSWHH